MSKSKNTDRICVFVLAFTLVITLLFMNGEQIGIVKAESDITADEKGIFSDRDYQESWNEKTAVQISLDDMDHLVSNGAYTLNGDLYLVDKGTYVLTGELKNQQIFVDAKGAKLQIVLNGVNISEEDQPAIHVVKADKVFLTLAPESENMISVGKIIESQESNSTSSAENKPESEESDSTSSVENKPESEESNSTSSAENKPESEDSNNADSTEKTTEAEKDDNADFVEKTIMSEKNDIPDAAIYSTADLTINGTGSLKVEIENGHGIKSKDDLVVTNGNITVKASETALLGKDSVRIADGTFDLQAGTDGIKANNDSDEEKGYITIIDGIFVIQAAHDGIQAETDLNIEGGTFEIITGGGSGNGKTHTDDFGMGGFGNFGDLGRNFENSDNIDNFGRGNRQDGFSMRGDKNQFRNNSEDMEKPTEGMQMPEGMERPFDEMQMPEGMERPAEGMQIPAGMEVQSNNTNADSEELPASTSESDSYKGMKAGHNITISGGSFSLDCADDAIHSDGNAEMSGGIITLATGDDGVHAENNVRISDGKLTITKSYEGIEGNKILISGGTIDLTSSDDGINASGGISAGVGLGMRNFMGGNSNGDNPGSWGWNSEKNEMIDKTNPDQTDKTNDTDETENALALLHITGGTIYVNASGDGLDSNGDLIIDDGFIVVNGPTNSGNGALDSGTESGGDCVIHGGTVIALGASGMAENFSENSTQCSFNCILSSNFNEGDEIIISDSEGNVIYTYTVQKSGNSIVFSSPELKQGETYTITAGDQSSEMTLTSISNGSSYSMGMGMRGGFH